MVTSDGATQHIANFETVLAGKGADTLYGLRNGMSIDGAAGTDEINFSSEFQSVTVDLSLASGLATDGLRTMTLAGIENVVGSDFGDVFSGDENPNTFDGGLGSDTVNYAGLTKAVTVNLETGSAFGSGSGSDRLLSIENAWAGSGNDLLTGNEFANVSGLMVIHCMRERHQNTGHTRSGQLGNGQRAGKVGMHHFVELAQEGNRFEVLAPAVHVRQPLAGLAAVVAVEHRGHGVHAQAVHAHGLQPEQRVVHQEVPHRRVREVVDERVPVAVNAFAPVGVFVQRLAVKARQDAVLAEMKANR